MRLPVCDGQAQPEASTSGRPHEYHGVTGPATWRRDRVSMHRQAKRQSATLLPMWTSAPKSKNRQQQSLTCAGMASVETQNARLEPPQVIHGKGTLGALPEHWKEHLQKVKKGDERRIQSYIARVAQINALEASTAALSDKELAAKTVEFQHMLAGGKSMDELLPEAFAVVREASKRILNMRHFDVQLIGGMALHEGTITEMATGEGKTLAATLPAYLNALSGKGVHIVTVNDYLAKRDSEWMGRLYSFLGLSVGVVQEHHSKKRRQAAFEADITYVTSNALGFTYLLDTSTAMSPDELAIVKPFNYAIVDEADSVLIDDCMTPLVLSATSDTVCKEQYVLAHKVIDSCLDNGMPELREQIVNPDSRAVLEAGHYVVDRQSRRVSLTPGGMMVVLRLLVALGHEFAAAKRDNRPPTISDLWEDDSAMGPYVLTALCARELHKRDVQYIVRDGEVKIVNSSTGRVLPQSRWMDDLHQAIEAQEPGVEIKPVTRAVSSITYQTLFKYYPKLSGMTGTAISAEEEFFEVYNLSVLQIPTHKPSIRLDHPARVYLSKNAYLDALYDLVTQAAKDGRPMLIGSASIADSDYFSKLLSSWKVPHQMLNARPQYVRREAKVIAQAGVPGVITIATNMAGRGVDVLMGGNPQGLAQMALEQLVFKRYLSEEEWALEYEELPSYYYEFGSNQEMQRRLPAELYGTIRRVQALVEAGLDVDLDNYTVKDLVLSATQKAEELHQRLVTLHDMADGKRSFQHSWRQMVHLLENAERSESGREDLNGAAVTGAILNGATIRHNFNSELAKALLALWLYFDLECADSADLVRKQGGLLVLVLAIQESERVDRQLKGRAGRQGDPGETYSLVRMDDPQATAAGMGAGLQIMQPFFEEHGAEMPYMEDGVSRMFIGALRRSLEQGRQDARLRLARSDETVEVFRHNKVQLRMQLLTGSMQDRRRILRAAIVDFAQWLVKSNTDLAFPPCDPEWNLDAIISQARHVINPPTDEDEHLPMPKSKHMVRMLRDILKVREQNIPVAPARDVLGPDAHSVAAQRLRRALILRPRDPDFGPVAGVTPALQAELKAHILLQHNRAELEGSGFNGRWMGGAEALVLHIAASLVVAYEQLKEGPIMEAFAKWKAYYLLATADADFKPEVGSDEELREKWEMNTMIKELDDVWSEFLRDVDSVKTAVGVRAFAHLSPDDEFRLEASDLFLQTLRALRQRWVTRVACGPSLYVDLQVAQEGSQAPPIELDIGPPIHDLSEGLDEQQHRKDSETLALQRAEPDSNGAGSDAQEGVGHVERSRPRVVNPAAVENGHANGQAPDHLATAVYHMPTEEANTTRL